MGPTSHLGKEWLISCMGSHISLSIAAFSSALISCRKPIWGEEGREGTGDDRSIVSTLSVKNLCPSGITGEDGGELKRGESELMLRMSAASKGERGGDSIASTRGFRRGVTDRVGGVRPGGIYPILCTATRPLFPSFFLPY